MPVSPRRFIAIHRCSRSPVGQILVLLLDVRGTWAIISLHSDADCFPDDSTFDTIASINVIWGDL